MYDFREKEKGKLKDEKKELVSVTISLRREHVMALEELASGVEGNRSLVIRKLIETEMERRLGE